eukprot:754437-Hanusia_phi.AAC.6
MEAGERMKGGEERKKGKQERGKRSGRRGGAEKGRNRRREVIWVEQVMGLRAGMAGMEACFLHDVNLKISAEVFTHWATMVV